MNCSGRDGGHVSPVGFEIAKKVKVTLHPGEPGQLVDLSPTNVVLCCGLRVMPDSPARLTLEGPAGTLSVTGRVVRCHVRPVVGQGVNYEKFITLDELLDLSRVLGELAEGPVVHDVPKTREARSKALRELAGSSKEPTRGLAGEETQGAVRAPGDRRRHVRVRGPFDGIWAAERGPVPVTIADLSEGGCFVEYVCAIEAGERLTLSIRTPESNEISVVAEVVTVESGLGFAVCFLELTEGQKNALRRVVEQVY